MPTEMDPTTRKAFASELAGLCDEFRGIFGAETVERYVSESIDRMQGARLTDFLPLFVHRFARQRLRALAQAEGRVVKNVPEVLFVCVHNSGRSQMAAGLLNKHAEGRVHIRTAGSDPADEINPVVSEVLAEVGVDVGEEFPKPLTDEFVRAADVVITMGCGDACPTYPGKRYEDWELDDPEGRDLRTVRAIRDEIEARVQRLLDELVEHQGRGAS